MKCNNCDETLVPVFPEHPGNQFIGALHLRLVPGYGEYFDGDDLVDIFICGGCTDKVLNGVLENVKEHIYDELGKAGVLMNLPLPDIEGVFLFDEDHINPKYQFREGEWAVVLPHRIDLYRGSPFGTKVMEINHDGTAAGIESAVKLALGVK